jgi:hypothetical protein
MWIPEPRMRPRAASCWTDMPGWMRLYAAAAFAYMEGVGSCKCKCHKCAARQSLLAVVEVVAPLGARRIPWPLMLLVSYCQYSLVLVRPSRRMCLDTAPGLALVRPSRRTCCLTRRLT